MPNRFAFAILMAGLLAAAAAPAAAYHKTSPAVEYKCLFNHELLIISHNKQNSREFIQGFVAKLEKTDVDAVMCCPTMWRTNLYPSEVDPGWKKYSPEQPKSKFPSWDHIMRYLHSGGDPVRDTLDACRQSKKDFFVSYRMNDHHYVTDLEWPSHNAFWREHPEYWLGDSATSPYTRRDDVRLFNYLIPAVRDYYFAILEELCTKYDVDGVELDFQRFPKFFPSDKLEEGTQVMTAFVARVKQMMDRIGRQRGKSLKLCVRVPETLAKCRAAGLDVPGWDAAGLVEMVNVSSFYMHTMELGIEEFQARTHRARVYGEMNFVTTQGSGAKFDRRYTTVEIYRASALNLLSRGADGLSLFNYDYAPQRERAGLTEGLCRITDVEFLKAASKDYVVYPGFGSLPATNRKALSLIIPDDTAKVRFQRAVLRVETKQGCADLEIAVHLNGKPLETCTHEGTELFRPLADNPAYPTADRLKFYAVPLDRLVAGSNQVELENRSRKKGSCTFFSLEIAMYR